MIARISSFCLLALIASAGLAHAQNESEDGEKPDLKYIKQRLTEASKMYRECLKQYSTAKTTAEKEKTLIKHYDLIKDWAEGLEPATVEFTVRVKDVKRKDDLHEAIVETITELVPYQKSEKQVAIIELRVDLDDAADKVTAGSRLQVRCKLVPSLCYWESESGSTSRRGIYGLPSTVSPKPLFCLRVTEGALGNKNEENEIAKELFEPFVVDFAIEDMEVVRAFAPKK
jgi:hypothetical protein